MSEPEGGSFIPGPLDELVPGLRAKKERLPALTAHPRISRLREDDGGEVIVLASFATSPDQRAFHRAWKPIVEAALLSALSQPEPADAARLNGLSLYTFVPLPFEPDAALALFGFAPSAIDARSRHALALLRRESQLVEGLAVEEPILAFRAHFGAPTHPLGSLLRDRLRNKLSNTVWGAEPGALARTLAQELHGLGYAGVEPTRAGIERAEALLIPEVDGAIRWMDPLCFQALCDLIAVAAHNTWGANVEWAVCEPDPDTSLAPPPLVRVYKHRDRSSGHVPLGEHVLRWCMMPRQAGEDIPTLGAWAEHEFT